MTSGSCFTEIPLAYPCQAARQQRFVVNDSNGSIYRETNDAGRSNPLYDASIEMERFRGSASVSFLRFGIKEAIVTTSAIPSEPEVLSVSVSWNGYVEGASTSVELDLGREMTSFSCPVKTQCFAIEEDSGNNGDIGIVMVDIKGAILSLRLEADTLTPIISSLKICSVPEMLKSRAEEGEEMYTDTELESSMVGFISSTVLLVALSTILLTIDIESKQIAMWSEIHCQEEMRSRREVFGSIFTTAGNLLLGHVDENFIDMPPTAALCVASNGSNDALGYDVFTLHSDASLRRWRIDPSTSLQPFEVKLLRIPGQGAVVCEPLIPPPSEWSYSCNSVAISARLYESIYAVAVQVQTIDSSLSTEKSRCHLVVLHGAQDIRSPLESSLHLPVPGEASSLVGMDFLPNMKRCSLRALFQTAPQTREDFNETLVVTYPPSITSIVSAQPILSSSQDTLDGVAKSERHRICSLSFDIRDTNTSVDEDLHELDSWYMKFFFRPSYPRGSGTVVAPTDSTIRKTLGKLVPGHRRSADPDMSIQLETLRAIHLWRRMENRGATPASSSVQREVVVATSTSDAISVYHSFVTSTPTHDTTDGMDVDDEYDTDGEERERSLQLAAHEKRWKRFLLAVWEEEQILRTPLCLSLLPIANGRDVFLVRIGITSVLYDPSSLDEESRTPKLNAWDMLDKAALKLLSRIHKDKDRSVRLGAVETAIWDIISKAQLLLPSSSSEESKKDALNELCTLGSWSLDDEIQDVGGTYNEVTRAVLEQVLGSVSSDALMSWLEKTPLTFGSEVARSLPALSLLSSGPDVDGKIRNDTDKKHIPATNTRHAASSLSLRCVDSVRHLQLGRCLLLFGIGQEGSKAYLTPHKNPMQQAAFTSYLQSLSILWTSSQPVAMPSTPFQFKTSTLPVGGQAHPAAVDAPSPSGSPPLKRPSFGDEAPAGLLSTPSSPGITKMTTAIDLQLIHLSQLIDESQSPWGEAILLARAFFRCAFGLDNKSARRDVGMSKASLVLPELGALPPSANENVPSDYPRLALRLLAPFNAYPPEKDSVHVVRARSEASAECLLIEANALSRNGAVNETRKRDMIHKACELLVPTSLRGNRDLDADLDQIEKAVILLRSRTSGEELQRGKDFEDALVRALQEVLRVSEQRPSSVAAVDVRRLSQLQATRTIFLPLISSHPGSFRESFEAIGMDELTMSGTKLLVAALLRVSNLNYRLSMLERHLSSVGSMESSMSSSGSALLLEYIESAIAEICEFLPSSVYRSMSEYATLWSMLFRHAVAGRRWKKAYDACVNNPILERKVNNYRRLVLAMVESGSLGELLGMCSVVSGGGSVQTDVVDSESATSIPGVDGGGERIDMYEIAAETLAEASTRGMVTAPIGTTNYGGCLYALHASYGHWRRAAQAMDMRYHVAKTFLETSKEAEIGMIIEDISLAALGALHSLQMVKEPSERFFIAGELGPYPILPVVRSPVEQGSFAQLIGKRGRGDELVGRFGSSVKAKPAEGAGEGSSDRLSKFMTGISLARRVVQTMSLRHIFLDGSVSSEETFHSSGGTDAVEKMDIWKMFLDESSSADTDRGIIDRLSFLGYYQHALLLAQTMKDNCQELTGGQPNGRDQVQDAVSYVLRSHLVPAAVRSSRPQPQTAEQENHESYVRPTFSQLCRAFDEINLSCASPSQFSREAWGATDWLANSAKGTVAMALIRKLVAVQSHPGSPIALEVAGYFLDFDSGRAQLPNWLERLLMGFDANADGDTRGLFSRRSTNIPSAPGNCYRGDPPGLLRLYMKRSMYVEACDVVSAVLSGALARGKTDSSRETKASSRLPEKGDIDFVPYRVIDVLWDLVESAIDSPSTLQSAKTRMAEARTNMEKALQKHFELMKISEMGMQSARALTQ